MTTPPLQPGQYWRTRAGDIRYVAAVLPEWSGIQMPVIVLHNGGSGDIFIDQYTRQGGFLIYNRESDHDLVTYLPDCTSLDWVPPLQKKYYKTGTEHSGYFRVDSKDSYFWITPDGREVRQCGSPDILTKSPFVEITKEEAESRVKKSDRPETVIEINDSVLSLLNTPTALLINGEIAGLITEVEFGLMNDDIRQKTPVARQYLGVSVSPPEVLKPPAQTSELPGDRSKHTAPYVYSLIGEASKNNDYHSFENASVSIGCLIRICSAQQSMLSELSAQVDALRSQIASGEPR